MSRHSLLNLLLSVLAVIVSSACADDLRHRNVFDGGAGDAVISFYVENIALTRSGSDKESVIDHAYLLFYSSEANPEVDNPLAAVKALVSESNPGVMAFKMPLSLDPDTDYRLVAVANADNYVPEGFGSFRDYLEVWCRDASTERECLRLFQADALLSDAIEYMPMYGRVLDDAPFRFSIRDGVYKLSTSLTFRRSVARIDVANIVKDGFDVEGVALCNWRDAVSAVSCDSQLGNKVGSLRGVLADGGGSGELVFVDMPDADENGIQQLRQTLYCFPSVSYDSHPSDRKSTGFIIKARYGDDSESSYYRVNVGVSGNKSEVKANTKYLVTIQSVKGRGAATPEEAYSAEESQVVLSIVQDWDLEGSFAMDDNGNFLVLSTGSLEFDGNLVANKEVRILTSKGLTWTVDYVADNDASASAFIATRLSDESLTIGTSGKNLGEEAFSGKFVVSAITQDGGKLSADIHVVQNAAKVSEEPIIPEDMPFALVPLSYERVKIDHDARTIEIDGFDPDCFNSFIDVPFRLYIRPDRNIESVNVFSTLLWPLEGRVSLDPSGQYRYCNESFNTQGSGQVQNASGVLIGYSSLFTGSLSLRTVGDVFYVSVGAMGPDDPAIPRQITLTAPNDEQITYELTVKPHDAIIDDVILTDASGNPWFIMDRNVQVNDKDHVGRDSNGRKWQAYNFIKGPEIIIPFKLDENGMPFSESKHDLYSGYFEIYKEKNYKNDVKNNRKIWLNKYKCSNSNDPLPRFYDEENIDTWIFPSQIVMKLCCDKMKMSKMRLFLVSDYPAKNSKSNLPICCYWPYQYGDEFPTATSWFRNGYIISDEADMDSPSSIIFIFYNGEKVMLYNWTLDQDDNGFTRLVRPLTKEELDSYKNNYLGYGAEPQRLQLCHPDTYTSESLGWIPE